MQPCSQPRYGLTERSKPMSGEALRVRIVFGCSMVTVVRRFGRPSSASTVSSHSPSSTLSFRLKRVGVELRVAPRPLIDSTGIGQIYAYARTKQELRARMAEIRGEDSGAVHIRLVSLADEGGFQAIGGRCPRHCPR